MGRCGGWWPRRTLSSMARYTGDTAMGWCPQLHRLDAGWPSLQVWAQVWALAVLSPGRPTVWTWPQGPFGGGGKKDEKGMRMVMLCDAGHLWSGWWLRRVMPYLGVREPSGGASRFCCAAQASILLLGSACVLVPDLSVYVAGSLAGWPAISELLLWAAHASDFTLASGAAFVTSVCCKRSPIAA